MTSSNELFAATSAFRAFVLTKRASCSASSSDSKYTSRDVYVRQVPGLSGDRLIAYATLACSTLRHRSQLHAPLSSTPRAEAASLASLLAAPMQSMPIELLVDMQHLGYRRWIPSLVLASRAAQARAFSTHPHVAEHTTSSTSRNSTTMLCCIGRSGHPSSPTFAQQPIVHLDCPLRSFNVSAPIGRCTATSPRLRRTLLPPVSSLCRCCWRRHTSHRRLSPRSSCCS